MSRTEFKTARRVKTATKFSTDRGIKNESYILTGSDLSSKDKEFLLNEDGFMSSLSFKQIKDIQKRLGVKSQAKTKSGLIRVIKKQLANQSQSVESDQGSEVVKKLSKSSSGSTIKEEHSSTDLDYIQSGKHEQQQMSHWEIQVQAMTQKQLREKANELGISATGNKQVLRNRLKKELKKDQDIGDNAVLSVNDQGSITAANFQEKDFQVGIVDHDIEPHKDANIDRLGEGMYAINQQSALGGEESLLVTVSDSDPRLRENNIDSNNHDVSNSEKRILAEVELIDKQLLALENQKEHFMKNRNDLESVKDTQATIDELQDKKELLKNSINLDHEPDSSSSTIQDELSEPDTEKKRGKPKGSRTRVTHFTDKQIDFNSANKIIIANSTDYFPVSYSKKLQKAELAKHQSFKKANLPVFYKTVRAGKKGFRSSNKAYTLSELREGIQKKDILVEKSGLLTDKEKNSLDYVSVTGQNLQAKTNGQVYKGLFSQDGLEVPFYDVETIRVDNDDAGHYIAYLNNLYAYGKNKENTEFGSSREPQYPDPVKANRFYSKQIISSLSTQRNKVIHDAVKDSLDEDTQSSALAYKDSAGNMQDLSLSEEQCAMVDFALRDQFKLKITTSDNLMVSIPYDGRDIKNDIKPVLTWKADSYEPEEVIPVNSDTLLKETVKRLNIEPDQAQILIEALYREGWINYPRADIVKADDEPIHLKRDFEGFKGSIQEKEILNIIYQADKHRKEGKMFIEKGVWVLKVDKDELTSNRSSKAIDQPNIYDDSQFDIKIVERGVSPEEMMDFLLLENQEIGTPATRTNILSALKASGILTLSKDRVYLVDRRGMYLSAANEYYTENNIKSGIILKKELSATDSFDEITDLTNQFQQINRDKTSKFIAAKAVVLIERENDITTLDSY